MTAARLTGTDEAAVSNVLGAILVFGLLVLALVMVQVRFVPVWDEDREARHVEAVIDQMSLFKADAERLATNATGGTVSTPLTVSPSGGFTFFQGSGRLGGEAAFTPSPSGAGITLSAPLLRITERGGSPLHALGETWITIPASGSLTDVAAVAHLRVRVPDPNSETNGDTATLALLDAGGAYAGKAVLTFLRDASERSIQTEIFSAASATSPITVQRESYFHQVDPDYVYVNLLDDELLFDQVLAAAEGPFTLQLTRSGLNADYTAAYTAGSGGTGGSPGGLVVPNYASTMPSGALSFDARNQRLPQQTFILEHGAILVVQPDGAAMLVPPTLSVTGTASQVVLDWVVPGLQGPSASLSGLRAATLTASAPGARTDIEGIAARLEIQIPTQQPAVWATHLDERLRQGGLSPDGPTPQFTLVQSTGALTMILFGPASAPTDVAEDVVLRYRQATLDLSILPAG